MSAHRLRRLFEPMCPRRPKTCTPGDPSTHDPIAASVPAVLPHTRLAAKTLANKPGVMRWRTRGATTSIHIVNEPAAVGRAYIDSRCNWLRTFPDGLSATEFIDIGIWMKWLNGARAACARHGDGATMTSDIRVRAARPMGPGRAARRRRRAVAVLQHRSPLTIRPPATGARPPG